MGSHSVTCHPAEVTFTPLVLVLQQWSSLHHCPAAAAAAAAAATAAAAAAGGGVGVGGGE